MLDLRSMSDDEFSILVTPSVPQAAMYVRIEENGNVGLSMMCYTLGKANRISLGDFQLSGLMGKLLYWRSRIASCFT